MFRVRSIPFPFRSAEGTHSLRRTRRPVDSLSGLQGLGAQVASPMASTKERQQYGCRSTRQPPQPSPRHAELSIRCWTGRGRDKLR